MERRLSALLKSIASGINAQQTWKNPLWKWQDTNPITHPWVQIALHGKKRPENRALTRMMSWTRRRIPGAGIGTSCVLNSAEQGVAEAELPKRTCPGLFFPCFLSLCCLITWGFVVYRSRIRGWVAGKGEILIGIAVLRGVLNGVSGHKSASSDWLYHLKSYIETYVLAGSFNSIFLG